MLKFSIMLKILQARLQQYVNCEHLEVHGSCIAEAVFQNPLITKFLWERCWQNKPCLPVPGLDLGGVRESLVFTGLPRCLQYQPELRINLQCFFTR